MPCPPSLQEPDGYRLGVGLAVFAVVGRLTVEIGDHPRTPRRVVDAVDASAAGHRVGAAGAVEHVVARVAEERVVTAASAQVREVRASQFLVPKTQLLEYRREEARVEFKSIEMRDGLDGGGEKAELLTRLQDKEPITLDKLENAVVAAATPVGAIGTKVTDAA